MIWSEDKIRAILKDATANPLGTLDRVSYRRLVYRMLQAVYERQTRDEQAVKVTKHVNGRGFNGPDAPILSDIAQKSIRYGSLTPRQTSLVARKLQKYAGQLALVASDKQQPSLPMISQTVPEPVVTEEPTVSGCSYCGEQGHEKTDCDAYWGDEFGRYEAEQEQLAFERKPAYRESLEGVGA
jgi:hypothetical protein